MTFELLTLPKARTYKCAHSAWLTLGLSGESLPGQSAWGSTPSLANGGSEEAYSSARICQGQAVPGKGSSMG